MELSRGQPLRRLLRDQIPFFLKAHDALQYERTPRPTDTSHVSRAHAGMSICMGLVRRTSG
jgi:hypothetical protein